MFKLKLLKFYYELSSILLPQYFESYRDVIERAPVRELRQHCIHPPLIRRVYAECSRTEATLHTPSTNTKSIRRM